MDIEAEEENKRLRSELEMATREIMRLHSVIDDHARRTARYVTENYTHDVLTQIDTEAMRTVVKLRPLTFEFTLREPLEGWSNDHREAFARQVVSGATNAIAEDVHRSIWGATKNYS